MVLDIGESTSNLVQINGLVNTCGSYDIFDANERYGLGQGVNYLLRVPKEHMQRGLRDEDLSNAKFASLQER